MMSAVLYSIGNAKLQIIAVFGLCYQYLNFLKFGCFHLIHQQFVLSLCFIYTLHNLLTFCVKG